MKKFVYSRYCSNANGLSATVSMAFIHKGSLSVNDAIIQEDFYDACGWSESQHKQDCTELETEHFQCGLKLMSQ